MARNNTSIIDYFSPESSFATEFRRLLYKITHAEQDRELKSVLVTSSTLSEGKSTSCSLLGITAAKEGLRTLVIDCDLRRPSIHRLFNLDRDLGVCEILVDGAAVKKVVKKSGLDRLDIITAGKVTALPSEIFDSARVGNLIEEVKFFYDLILVDSPPIVPVSDPMFLAQEVDGVVLVVKAGVTQREVVSRSVGIIRSGDARLIGVVLNDMSSTLPYYYDYGYYGYRYEQRPPKSGGRPHRNSRHRKHRHSDSEKQDDRAKDESLHGKATGQPPL